MPNSTRWSGASGNCRPDRCVIAWRPSRWVIAILMLLSVLAPVALLASEMPHVAAWPLALAAAWHGLAAARREARRPCRLLELPAGFSPTPDAAHATLDGIPLAEASVAWRGPLAFLRWRDTAGRRGRLAWWPDTLPPAERRVLKLWSPGGAGMAP